MTGYCPVCVRPYPDCKCASWVGLTKMELIKCGVFPWGMSYRLYEAIEAKLKEKNGYAEQNNSNTRETTYINYDSV